MGVDLLKNGEERVRGEMSGEEREGEKVEIFLKIWLKYTNFEPDSSKSDNFLCFRAIGLKFCLFQPNFQRKINEQENQ